MVAEEVIITLSGGAPWGFRLQGGLEHQKPLQVAKVRKRSKACRAGLREGDELVSINDNSCGSLSHAQAMNLIDSMPGMLHIRVKRAPAGFQSVVLVARAPSPRIDKEYRAALRAMSPSSSRPHQPSVRQIHRGSLISPTGRSGLTSPPGSEAYYGETDSDADVAAHERQRKPKRRSPSNSPGKAGRASPEGAETSEMSGYDSASDAQVYHLLGHNERGDTLRGVARKEVIYQPPLSGVWSSQTSTETSSVSADDQNPQEGLMEEDSGFQETTNVPLVSPERAKEALMLSSRAQLVPMVGPVDNPVDEELTLTYMDKAKQAKLNRGETVMDKQVKEARSKCRTIASLLTDAPNPHSKGVLMFKKRRQRSKKYTLTSFGSVDEDMRQSSQDEDGTFPGSESEFDEEGFSAAPDPTWDSDYLDMLEKRSVSRGLEGEGGGALSPGLSDTSGKGAQLFEQQRRRAEEHAKKMEAAQEHLQSQMHAFPELKTQPQLPPDLLAKPNVQPPPVAPKPTKPSKTHEEVPPTEMQTNISTPQATPTIPEDISNTIVLAPVVPITNLSIMPAETVMLPSPTPLPELPPSSVLNRTARPFAPGCITHRAATAPVVFRPSVSKKTPRPVSVAVMAPPFSTASEECTMGVTSASFASQLTGSQSADAFPQMIPTHHLMPGKPTAPPTASVESYSQPAHHFSSVENIQVASVPPPMVQTKEPSYSLETQTAPGHAIHIDTTVTSVAPIMPPQPKSIPPQASTTLTPAAPVTPTIPVTPVSPVVYRDKTTPTGSRTGILQEARCRSLYKPMFKVPDIKKNSPNPELLSMVQNLDERPRRGYYEPETVPQNTDDSRIRVPPPVAPKPRIITEISQIPQAEGKGAELFARRQSRMDLFVVDSPPPQQPLQQTLQQQQSQSVIDLIHPLEPSSGQSQWKYSPNVRAPPPIGYNPLLSPSCPVGLQRGGAKVSEERSKGSRGGYGTQKEGIKALDFMRRQPYQLNSAMFSFGDGVNTQSSNPSYQRQQREGHTLNLPRQIPVKAARVFEIKRFSTPTPMSAPTLNPTVIVPRSQTTLGEHLSRSDMASPPPAPASPRPPEAIPQSTSAPSRVPGLPELPKISAVPISHPVPYSPPAPMSSMSSLNYPGLQAAKQFKSAPELSFLPPNPIKSPVQAPKPRFIASRVGIQPRVWRPGTLPQ
ncbi:synaptopodin 2-like protein isoform X1 [Triplophysa rosa]|uniref:Synaptopodin 2-like protein n=1 Tax=Triplophysa rosa TaxID=992332 RepID=A0A9W7WNA5_TRIRA|nr:synaptopodin 2-like protein isoform X1 [Triplophysa rosa]KAI7805343.1 putative synaptopodin 2-like protein [Triplophysa rosa]